MLLKYGKMRKASLIGSLLVAGVAAGYTLTGHRKAPTGTMMFHSSEASLALLSAEAKRCGLRHMKTETIGRFLALVVETPIADPRADCLIRWILAHPEADIGFLGNQAVATEPG